MVLEKRPKSVKERTLKRSTRTRIFSYKGVQQDTNLIFVPKLRVAGLEFGPKFLSVCDVSSVSGELLWRAAAVCPCEAHRVFLFAVREEKRASLRLFCNDGRKDSERVQEQRVEGYEKGCERSVSVFILYKRSAEEWEQRVRGPERVCKGGEVCAERDVSCTRRGKNQIRSPAGPSKQRGEERAYECKDTLRFGGFSRFFELFTEEVL